MRTTTRKKVRTNFKELVLNDIYNNLKFYIIVIIIFLIGITAGVIFINNTNEVQRTEIGEYINSFITSLRGDFEIDKGELLKSSLIENFKLAFGMWFIGSTVIGIPIVLGIVIYRGFCIGYTVSSGITILGTQKGIIFFLTTILAQNIIIIPVIISLAVSGMKLYKSIMKDKRRENIKIEIIRHTIISIISFIFLILASFIEVYISTNLLTSCIQFL